MSKRNLFISFAESDGGHSYLAARAMLDPASIAHLIFRNTVAESLEAVAAGQANYAIVPAYNSITQWEGATLKALSSGQYEICAQVCMPTSYVLVAHKDYMSEFVNTYAAVKAKDPAQPLSEEEAAKIYTRFLSRIFVGPQAEEQYRGRLIRPDMTHATIELSRNPLRILEELTRSDLLKAMTATPRQTGGVQHPNPQVNIGGTPYLAPITTQVMAPPTVMEMMQAPAALVASGLLDAPGDPEGWDQPGSLGEIVALLRKLLVLLNVYSFGSPDLPENKTQYVMLGRRGFGAPAPAAIKSPAAAPSRIMVLVKPTLKKSTADQWLKPRAHLVRKAHDHGYVFDRAPLMLSPSNTRVFLFEGGRPKEGVLLPSPVGALERLFGWVGDRVNPPPADKSGNRVPTPKEKSLRKALERKPDGMKDDSPGRFDTMFLGQYPTWCHGLSDDNCWCCEEAHGETAAESAGLWQFLVAALVALTVLALLIGPAYCAMTGSCNWFGTPPQTLPQLEAPSAPATFKPTPPVDPPKPAYPGLTQAPPAAPPVAAPPPAPPPKIETPKTPVFHVAFFETKWNLTSEAVNELGAAASQSLQHNRPVMVRVVALGPRETDEGLWHRRLFAVKDELVRLGVPANRIRYEGSGPYVVAIRPDPRRSERPSDDTDSVADAMSSD